MAPLVVSDCLSRAERLLNRDCPGKGHAPQVRTMSATQECSVVEVSVNDDRMKAWLHYRKDADPAAITKKHIESALESADITLSDDVVARIRDCLESLTSASTVPGKCLIAEGRAPVEPECGRFEWSPEKARPPAASEEGAKIGFRPSGRSWTVRKETIVGRVYPATEGVDGVDVHGAVVKPKLRASVIEIGPHVKLLEDGSAVSETYGNAVFRHDQISVEDILEIANDVDMECGNLDHPYDIHIHGMVLDSLEVKCKQSITIDGRIAGAKVEAAMDVMVNKGIIGGKKGKVSAGGRVATMFCEEADLQAQSDIHVSSGTVNSKLVTDGKVVADQAKIIGGTISAKRGAVVGILGNDAEAPTSVAVGTHAGIASESGREMFHEEILDLQREKLELEIKETGKLEDAATMIKRYLQIAVDQPEKLSDERRQRALELLAQADRIEQGVRHRNEINNKLAKIGEPVGTADIVIMTAAYPKVTLTIDDRQTRVTKLLTGPVRIEKRKLKNVSELIAVNLQTGSYTRLQSERLKQ